MIGLVFSVKFSEWSRIEKIGFKSEIPLLFLKNPDAYTLIGIILFVVVLIFVDLAWYIVVGLFFLSFIVGGIAGENTVRKVGKEMGAKEEKIEELIAWSKKKYPYKKYL